MRGTSAAGASRALTTYAQAASLSQCYLNLGGGARAQAHTAMNAAHRLPAPTARSLPAHRRLALQCAHASLQCAHASLQCAHASPQCAHASLQCAHASPQCAHASLQCAHASLQCPHASLQCAQPARGRCSHSKQVAPTQGTTGEAFADGPAPSPCPPPAWPLQHGPSSMAPPAWPLQHGPSSMAPPAWALQHGPSSMGPKPGVSALPGRARTARPFEHPHYTDQPASRAPPTRREPILPAARTKTLHG